MNYFLIAGEASGDMHAAALIRAIKQEDPSSQFAGLGGDLMQAAGCKLYQDYRKMAFMGIVAVVKNLPAIRENFRIAKEALVHEQPDVLIVVDYPSFNLRMAGFCRKRLPHTRIVYYIPPKVWAWKRRRVHRIAQLSNTVLGIFPFEPAFYQRYGYDCIYVGNPTMDAIRLYKERCSSSEKASLLGEGTQSGDRTHETSQAPNFISEPSQRQGLIAILPGSRRSEISHCLPLMLEAAKLEAEERRIAIAGAPGIEKEFYTQLLGEQDSDMVVFDSTYDLLSRAEVAIVNSGTATLETALLGCPQVPVYYLACSWIGHLRPILFSSPYFTLPNIILQRELLKEKIAHHFTLEEVRNELHQLLNNNTYRQQMLDGYEEIARILGNRSAAEMAAQIITGML